MSEKFCPQPENPKQNSPEAGAGPLGIPPPTPEQSPQGGGSTSPERQSLPSVWDVLERDVRFGERYDKDFPTRQEYEEGERELNEVKRLKSEQYEKGTPRDKLILDLYNAVTLEPSGLPVLIPYNRSLSRKEYQQFRSKVEPLSEEQLDEEVVKAEEDFKRREDAHPGRRPPPPDSIISV